LQVIVLLITLQKLLGNPNTT